MKQKDIYNYTKRFFLAKDCKVEENRQTETLTVELTPELDEKLMNRIFYWYYMNKIGGNPEPLTITLEKDKDLYFGSPRLHQLFNLAIAEGQFIRFYETPGHNLMKHEPLYPWLTMHVKVTYKCDLSYDRLLSIGIQLLNGMTITGFNDAILTREIQATIPDLCYTMMPLISPNSAIVRIEKLIQNQLSDEPFEWAELARQRWQEELNLLNKFDEDSSSNDSVDNEKKALQELYEPKITVQTMQAGLVYLSDSFVKDLCG